jgi:hypothetical protein
MTVVAAGQAATKLRHRTPEERRRARAAPPESETRTTPLRSSGCRSVVSMTENKDSDDVEAARVGWQFVVLDRPSNDQTASPAFIDSFVTRLSAQARS